MYESVMYKTDDGVEITLTPEIIRSYLIKGVGASTATTQEIVQFMELCRHQRLNPFLKEAYLIKPEEGKPATILAGKDAFAKRAQRNERFNGYTAGVIVRVAQHDAPVERVGSLVLPNETLVGGWAKVFRSDWVVPAEITVALNEYKRTTPIWGSKPATMIRKVALVQALREAFPELAGMYAAEEMDGGEPDIATPPPIPAPTSRPMGTATPFKAAVTTPTQSKPPIAAASPEPATASVPTPKPEPAVTATSVPVSRPEQEPVTVVPPASAPAAEPNLEDVFVFMGRTEKVSPKGTPYNELHLLDTFGEQVTVISDVPAVIATASTVKKGHYVNVAFAPKGRSKHMIAKGLEIMSPSVYAETNS